MVLRPDCAPSSERPQFQMRPVRNRWIMWTQHFWICTSVVDCRCTPPATLPVLPRHATIGGRLPEWQTSKCISSVSFVNCSNRVNFFTIHRSHRRKKMMDQISEIWILWFLKNFLKFGIIPLTHAPETGARNRRQKTGVGFWSVCHTIWRQIFSGARFWSRIEHVLFCDRIWRPRDQNTDMWLVSVQCCCCFRSLEL